MKIKDKDDAINTHCSNKIQIVQSICKVIKRRKNVKSKRWRLRVCSSIAQFKRHNFPIDDVVGRVVVRDIDPWVLSR